MRKNLFIVFALACTIAGSCVSNENIKTENMNKVMWFDIPANDLEASAKFYKKIFGWNILPADKREAKTALHFQAAITSPSSQETLTPNDAGAINGGIVTRNIGITQPTILIQVESIEEKIKKIQDAGGKLIKEKTHLPLAGGYFAYVTDPDENVIGLWEVEK
jgi:predicted enzyme related to lactoylglutathione lyase